MKKDKSKFYRPDLTEDEQTKYCFYHFHVYLKFAHARRDFPDHDIKTLREGDIDSPRFVDEWELHL